MASLKVKELQHETGTWKGILGSITDENIHLKNKISEILKNNFDTGLLEEVEVYHTIFIQEDERIGLLKNEVTGLDKILAREIFEDGVTTRKLDEKLKILRNNIHHEQEHFARIKQGFNNYISENIIETK